MSADVKDRLFDGFPRRMVLTEAIGSSESPAQAVSITVRGQGADQALRFNADERTTVFDDDLRPVRAGSGDGGAVGHEGPGAGRVLPRPREVGPHLCHASTVSGGRFPVTWPPSRPTGRSGCSDGGPCASTSGGEKVYPEEVEAVLKMHPAIVDAVVVGVPDPRLGERVAAVVQPAAGFAGSGLRGSAEPLPGASGGSQGATPAVRGRPGSPLSVREGRLPLGQAGSPAGDQAGDRTWPRGPPGPRGASTRGIRPREPTPVARHGARCTLHAARCTLHAARSRCTPTCDTDDGGEWRPEGGIGQELRRFVERFLGYRWMAVRSGELGIGEAILDRPEGMGPERRLR